MGEAGHLSVLRVTANASSGTLLGIRTFSRRGRISIPFFRTATAGMSGFNMLPVCAPQSCCRSIDWGLWNLGGLDVPGPTLLFQLFPGSPGGTPPGSVSKRVAPAACHQLGVPQCRPDLHRLPAKEQVHVQRQRNNRQLVPIPKKRIPQGVSMLM
ncbi:uncharacterized protein LY79DRAFT_354575 [Colletotrichum navitas]|uniref:Uncharacterized protein n=1 Tax=Colletotrichum navitas TaxID=681940 RepID=A0AAD8V814_9PEZI|nr:uncharacterized protein LY79DRAFT_354575 [Colletotrichum navitas]KAK1597722.1 hypothetical protein LY79DRAFT_354575 [Colletotrichum navitas]